MAVRRPRLSLLLLAAVVLTGLVPAIALGQDAPPPAIAIETADGAPAHVVNVSLAPGQQQTVPLRFAVGGDAAVEAEAWVANVGSPVNGGVSLSPPGVPPEGPAAWVSFPAGPLTLTPGSPVEIAVQIAVPADARAGLWTAAVAIQSVAPVPAGGSGPVGHIVREATMLAIQVEGELEPGFTLGEAALVERGRVNAVRIPIENSGNVPVSPRGTLSLFDVSADADAVFATEVAMGVVHAGVDTVLEIPIDRSVPGGAYTVALELSDPDSGATVAVEAGEIELPEPVVLDQAARADVGFQEASLEPVGDPVELVQVSATVNNTGAAIGQVRLVLVVMRNGGVLEEAVIADRVPLPAGVTTFTADYRAPVGFTPGEWTFTLRLAALDADGRPTTIATSDVLATLTVP